MGVKLEIKDNGLYYITKKKIPLFIQLLPF